MKKRILAFLMLAALAAGCGPKQQPENQRSETGAVGTAAENEIAATEKQQMAAAEEAEQEAQEKRQQEIEEKVPQHPDIPDKTDHIFPFNQKYGSVDGFYYISDFLDNEDGMSYANMRYVDYATGQDIALCNKPECGHNNDSCASYLSEEDMFGGLFWYEDHLYLVTGSAGISMDGEDRGYAPGVYQMDADGSNRTRVFSLDSGYDWSNTGEPFLVIDGWLYFSVIKEELVQLGDNSITSEVTEKQVRAVHLHTKEERVFTNLEQSENIMGFYDGEIITVKMDYGREYTVEEMLRDDFWQQAIEDASQQLFAYQLADGERTSIMELSYQKYGYVTLADGKLYYLDESGKTLYSHRLKEKEPEVLAENLPEVYGVFDVFDDKLLFLYGEHEETGAATGFFVIDANTGVRQDIDLFDEDSGNWVDIIADAGDDFLVNYHYIMERNYYAFADAWQMDTIGIERGFISKEDYFNGNPNYRPLSGDIGNQEKESAAE